MKVIQVNTNQAVTYFEPGEQSVYASNADDLYSYKTYVGNASVEVEAGDSVWLVNKVNAKIEVFKGPCSVDSSSVATVIRGYSCSDKAVKLNSGTNLPYVNGCSTRQVIPPERSGDPTYQQLQIPRGSSEQSHHIHSTARVVYVFEGEGWSCVGMEGNPEKTKLIPGMVAVFDPMTPHHFETEVDAPASLVVLPLHIYSSSGPAEFNHPMFNGTHMMNQGH